MNFDKVKKTPITTMEASVVVLPMKKTSCSTISRRFERYVNMENNTSERTRARWVHGRTKHINNLCNSYPILSFEAAVVVVPMTKTACSTITWRFERYVNMESTHPRPHPRMHPRPQHPPVHPPVVHPRPHPRMHPRPQHPRMHQWNPHKN